jgi:predicted NBD/HSP70 family sugar kinase
MSRREAALPGRSPGPAAPDLTGSNSGQAREHNQALVLQAIHRRAPISRAEIARQTGLTKPGIARIVDRLLDEGLILEARRRRGLRGQPAIELEINPEGCFSIGIDIDRDHLTILAVDATGSVRGRVHHESRLMLPGEVMELAADAISYFRRRHLVDEARLAGIGVAIPDWLGEVPFLGKPDAYRQWTDFDIRRALSQLTSHPIYIDNESNAAAMAELDYGLGAESRSFFYIYISACTGGGLVLDGIRHQGAMGLSGEIGWMPVTDDAGSVLGKIQPLGDLFSLSLLYGHLAQHGIHIGQPRELMTLDHGGRALVSAWLHRMSAHIAEAVTHIGLIVDPDAVIVGGRLPVRQLDELLHYVNEHLDVADPNLPSVHRATIEDAAALGAAAMPIAAALMLSSTDPAQRTRVPFHVYEPVPANA